MRRWAVVLSALSVSLGAATAVAGTASADNDNDPYTLSNGHAQAGPAGGVVHAKDARPGGGGPKQSPNLSWHGGTVRTGATPVYPVFWGGSWTTSSPVVGAMDTFYSGVGGSAYLGTNTEYTNAGGTAPNYQGTHVSTSVSYGNANYYDSSAAPSRGPSTTDVINAVARALVAAGKTPVSGAYYPVYADTPRGNAGYCAWHSYGSINGVSLQIGFFWKLDNDPGCDPQDTTTGHTPGVAALGNVSGHELSEMVTDPNLNAWYDSQGNENSDKCAWTFGTNAVSLGGTLWKIQGNWSNNAYNGNLGYSYKGSKVRGCMDGTN